MKHDLIMSQDIVFTNDTITLSPLVKIIPCSTLKEKKISNNLFHTLAKKLVLLIRKL